MTTWQQSWDRWSPKARDREQGHALVRWLTHEVRPFSPWWAERLEGRTIDALDDLRVVPYTHEDDVAGAGGPGNPALLLSPSEDGFKRHASRAELWAAARELRGRGSGGRRAVLFRRYKPVHVHDVGIGAPVAVAYTRSDLDRLHLAGARLFEVLGLGVSDAIVSAVPMSPSIRFWGLYHAALATRMVALHPRAAGQEPLPPVARALTMLPATVLAAPAEELLDLLRALGQEGVQAPTVRTLLAVGEPPTPDAREEMAEAASALGAVRVRVQSVWAPESSRVLWGECRPPAGDPAEATYGLHTYPDLEVVEVRDPERDRPAGEGEPGEVVVTSLGWRGTALIRYATGAWSGGLAATVACPACGRTVPRLAPQAADEAWQPLVETPDGRTVRANLRTVRSALQQAGIDDEPVRDWSVRDVDGRLVLGLDLETRDREVATRLGGVVAEATGVVPEVHLGRKAASDRPQVGAAGPRE